ncbi:MAG: 4-hydroxybutyryl-CoA dehydratase [Gracilibacteraceae bacterium]|jgi:4-hydroxybutyryl-CoA dehydratase/vinylacetyl-CoA-Delta-isomerase|nr:4-hydroxybutyryl-CoA dehydratase [Gracilibacteraceae bacterium]
MALMTGAQYEESLRRMKHKVYMFGELVDTPVDHPIIRPSMNAIKLSYDLAQDPMYADLMTATSHLSGQKVNRFGHLHQSTDDLIKKVKMLRLMGQKTCACFQRCAGMDATNASYGITYEMDQKLGTVYHKRFLNFFQKVQEEDLIVAAGVTDAKGDRGLAQNKQPDPDLFVRIVERKVDGIVVRGCKCHTTAATNAHMVLVMPTQAIAADAKDYAVSFVTPADAEGIVYVFGRQSCDTRKTENSNVDVGNPKYGSQEALMIFDDLFVPWENVLMDGETEWAGPLVERFATYHRTSYGGCKPGQGDVIVGMAALMADYNGTAKASHVKDKIIEMIHLNETLYSQGIAASAEGYKTPAGNYMVDLLLSNCCKHNVTRFTYDITRLLEDIAGGILVTLPSEKDFDHPVAGGFMKKYLQGSNVSAENRIKLLRLIENMTFGTGAVGYKTESMHGAGSPQAQRIQVQRYGNIGNKKALVKTLLDITD